MHWGDDRGQSIQIGAVLLFGALIVALAGYQAFVVPQQNERVEFSHSQTVQNDLQDLRNALVSMTGEASTRSVSVQLGTRYPTRVIAVNPGPPSGSLRTEGTSDESLAFDVENAQATGETGDFWNGTERNYSTGGLVYQPNYNLYGGAPETVYEHSALVNDFRSGTVPLAGQAFIQGRQITLVALNGSLRRSRAGTTSVDVRPVSTSTRTVSVTNTSGSRVTLELPTRFEKPVWEELLADQVDDGYVEDFDVVAGSPFNTLVVELTPGGNYTLRMAKAGVGTRVGGTSPAYMTRVTANETAVPEEGTETLVVEVRDAYNNPVSGVNVAGEARLGTLVDGNATTDSEGRATFRYQAHSVGSETTTAVEFSYPDRSGGFDAEAPEDVVLGVTVQNTKGATTAPSASGDAPFTVTWNSPSQDRSIDVGSEGDTLDMQAVVEDTTVVGKTTVEGSNLDFAVNNSTVATLSPGEAITGGKGKATTKLTAEANGTVRVYAVSGGANDVLNVTFRNVSSDPGPPGKLAYDDENQNGEYDSGETTYTRAEIEDGFDDGGVDLVIPSDVGTVSSNGLDISANSITSEVGFEATNGDLKLSAGSGGIEVTGQSLSAQNGDTEVTASGPVVLDSSSVESTTGKVKVEGDTVSAVGASLVAENDDLTVTATGGELDATSATLRSDTDDVDLESSGDMYLESASVEASNGDATAGLKQGSNTLFVDSAVIADSDQNLTYEPSGITVDGSPSSGTVSK